MAKTLADFKKEFAAIQKEVKEGKLEMEGLENNLESFREHIVEGMKILGTRIAELRAAGVAGADLAAFQGDAQVAAMLRELNQRRAAGKKAGAEADKLHETGFKGLRRRMKALRDGVTAEIDAREKKFSSKKLGLNQSVKEMLPLETAIVNYSKGGGDPDYEFVFNFGGTIPAAQYDSLYNDMLAEQLSKSAKAARTDQKLAAAKGKLGDRLMRITIAKVTKAATDLKARAAEGQAAQKARNVRALSAAKKAGSALLDSINTLVEPYEQIMANAKLVKMINESPDQDLIRKNTKKLFDLKHEAEQAADLLNGRTLAQ